MKFIYLWTLQHTGTLTTKKIMETYKRLYSFKWSDPIDETLKSLVPFMISKDKIPKVYYERFKQDYDFILLDHHLEAHPAKNYITWAKINNAQIITTIRNPYLSLISHLKRKTIINLDSLKFFILGWNVVLDFVQMGVWFNIIDYLGDRNVSDRMCFFDKLEQQLGLYPTIETKSEIKYWKRYNSAGSDYKLSNKDLEYLRTFEVLLKTNTKLSAFFNNWYSLDLEDVLKNEHCCLASPH